MKTSLNLIFLLVGLTTFSQIQELKNNDWYLDYVVINGNSMTPTTNQNIPYVTADFDIHDRFISIYCNWLLGDVAISMNYYVYENSLSHSLQVCNSPPGIMPFEYQYFDFFFTDQTQPFYYDIVTETNGDKTLTITSASGDEAVYSNQQPLSIQEIKKLVFKLYPNPVKSQLHIQTETGVEINEVFIHDLSGKMISTFRKSPPYDISALTPGLYFVKIESNQRVLVKKIIKK